MMVWSNDGDYDYIKVTIVSIYKDMIMANAITEPRIKDRLHCTHEAAPV